MFLARRKLHMPGSKVLPPTRHRLLPDPGVRAVRTHRDPVVGFFLDQHGVVSGQSLNRTAHRAHDLDHERRCESNAASSLLHQGTSYTAFFLFLNRACERSGCGRHFRSPLTPLSVTPAHSSATFPLPAPPYFFQVQFPLRSRSSSFRAPSAPFSAPAPAPRT